jgi:hypothetical protein
MKRRDPLRAGHRCSANRRTQENPPSANLPILLEQIAQLPRESAGCAWPPLAGCQGELVVGDGGAFEGAADE